jgi:hypothetical protein
MKTFIPIIVFPGESLAKAGTMTGSRAESNHAEANLIAHPVCESIAVHDPHP